MKKIFSLFLAAAIVLPLAGASFNEVNGLIKAKKWADAEKSCRALISETKGEQVKYIAYMKLMMVMRRLNKNAELIKDADIFLADCKNDLHAANLLIYRGIGERHIGKRAEAFKSFELAIDKAKDGSAAREAAYYCIDVASSLRKYAEADAIYQRAAKFKGADSDARLHIAAAYNAICLKKYDDALAMLDKVDAIEKKTVVHAESSLRYRGNILAAQKKYEEAISCYDKALALKLDAYYEGRLLWNKAKALESVGKKSEALEIYKKCAEYKDNVFFKRDSQNAVKRLSAK